MKPTESKLLNVELIEVKTDDQVEWMRVQRSRPELYKYFRQDTPITKEQQSLWWKTLNKSRVKLFIISDKGFYVGSVSFNPFLPGSKMAEFGIFIVPEHQHKGYATWGLKELLRRGFEDYNLSIIYSDCLEYPGENRFGFYECFGFKAFPKEHQFRYYMKQGKRIPSTRFYINKDMWRKSNDKNKIRKLETVGTASTG